MHKSNLQLLDETVFLILYVAAELASTVKTEVTVTASFFCQAVNKSHYNFVDINVYRIKVTVLSVQ